MAQTVSRRSVVYDILFQVEQGKKSAKEAEDSLKKIEKTAQKTESSLKTMGKAFLAAFTIEQLVQKTSQFVQESVKLAQAAEGVRKAFNNLNDPNLLNELRKATRGTVSDVQLMQAAVRAQNFKIPLQQLGTYFDFARQRARDTGQSVDYLVNSIIDGIGRKSTLVLDNLGLSAAEIQKEFAKTGDLSVAVSTIIQREMGDAGMATDGAADSIDRYNVAVENLKTELGEQLLPVIGKVAEALTLLVKNLDVAYAASVALTNPVGWLHIGMKLLGKTAEEAGNDMDDFSRRMTEALTQVTRQTTPFDELNKKIVLFGNTLVDVFAGKQDANVKVLNDRFKELKDELTSTDLPISKLRQLVAELNKMEEQLKKLTELDVSFNDFFTIKPEVIDAIKQASLLQRQVIEISDAKTVEVTSVGDKLSADAKLRQEYLRLLKEASIDSAQQIFGALSSLAADGSAAQIAFATAQILANQAQAVSGAIASATQAAALQGGSTLPFLIPSFVGITLSTLAQVVGLMNRAKAAGDQARSQANAFAEGEVDIHRPGETRGKDSIPAVIMPGESVITTDKTSRYKPFLQAIHEGTLEDLIRVNYVEPALAVSALENAKTDSTLDYSEKFYRQYLATNEGNRFHKEALSINQSAASTLRRIEKKMKKGGWYV